VAGRADVDQVVAQRLRTQRLTSEPCANAADVVRLLTCVQSQDAPMARFSLGLRSEAASDADVLDSQREMQIVRTHILRPTWHFVAAEDLRWIQALTASKVETGMAARHRNLGLDDQKVVDRGHRAITRLLEGKQFLTRRQISAELATTSSYSNEQLGHLLLLAELRTLICSAPPAGEQHTYGLVDELLPPTVERNRDEAIRELVRRFFTGHGPATITDLTRWTKLTQAEIKPALADLGDQLVMTVVDGLELWSSPEHDRPTAPRPSRVFLLSIFDEAYLTYPKLNFPRAEGHPSEDRDPSFGEAAGGVVICNRQDAGWWKRNTSGANMEMHLAVASSMKPAQRKLIEAEARRLAAFTGRTATVRFA
jgi:hypothetical protein